MPGIQSAKKRQLTATASKGIGDERGPDDRHAQAPPHDARLRAQPRAVTTPTITSIWRGKIAFAMASMFIGTQAPTRMEQALFMRAINGPAAFAACAVLAENRVDQGNTEPE